MHLHILLGTFFFKPSPCHCPGIGTSILWCAICQSWSNHSIFYHPEKEAFTPLIYMVIKGRRDRMQVGAITRIIKKYMKQVCPEHSNLPKSYYPHMQSTSLYQDWEKLELISKIFGHSNTLMIRWWSRTCKTMRKNHPHLSWKATQMRCFFKMREKYRENKTATR